MSQHEHSPSQPNQPQQSPAQDGIQPEPLRDLALSELQDTRLSPGKAKRVWRKIRALLSEEQIREAAREYYARRGRLPTRHSREKLSTYPATSWSAVYNAGSVGSRGLTKGRTLSKILAPLRYELEPPGSPKLSPLSEVSIIEAAREYYSRRGKLPTASSREKLSTYPATNWAAVNSAGWVGSRGLTKGRTLSKILAPLRDELANATEGNVCQS